LQGGREGDGAVPDFPEFGTALPVNLYRPVEEHTVSPCFPQLQNQFKSLQLPALGSWVKLKNVCAVVVEGQMQVLGPPLPLLPTTHSLHPKPMLKTMMCISLG